MNNNHTFFNFRRCPYAMRARMALWQAGTIPGNIVEVDLKDRPQALYDISPKGSVPVLQLEDGTVIDESLDIMQWALSQNDPGGWFIDDPKVVDLIDIMTKQNGKFKSQLDRYKYPTRYPDEDCSGAQEKAQSYLEMLDQRLSDNRYLFGAQRSYADVAIFPFIRQCANTNREWFDSLPLPNLQRWLIEHLEWDLFQTIMDKKIAA